MYRLSRHMGTGLILASALLLGSGTVREGRVLVNAGNGRMSAFGVPGKPDTPGWRE
jgi:hypothetical protein